jgi:small subunit ribosomal protein S27Ae
MKMAEKKKGKAKTKKSSFYQVNGEKVERKRTPCPKCGAGIFIAEHANRQTCGNCGFTQWKKK